MLTRLTLAFFLAALAQSQTLFIGRLLDASHTPPTPLPDNTKVTLLGTGQEALTKGGVFQLALPKTFIPGTEIQLEVKAGNLRIYLPPDGVLNVPAQTSKPFEIKLLPAGSKLFLEPAVIEGLLAQASKPAPQAPAKKNDEPPLQRFLKDWATKYGFGYEQVQKEVQSWGDQIRANPEKSTLRQQALAAFEAKNFGKSAELFRESAHEVSAELDSDDAEAKAAEERRRTHLRQFLDDEIRAAESLTNALKFSAAVDELTTATKRASREKYPSWWAEMQERVGLALTDAGEKGEGGGSVVSLSKAVDAYQSALQVYQRDSLPQNWAGTQMNLGNAYIRLGERQSGVEGMKSLQAGVKAYEQALTVYTKDALPQDWALAQMNLGLAYMVLGVRRSGEEGMKSLQASLMAYQQALTVYTKDALPQDWARTQMNLGVAYLRLGERQSGEEGMKSLQASVKAYEQALTVYTKDALPQDWARTQMDLGVAYMDLGERQSGEEGMKSLQASVKAYEQALTVYTKDALPQDWARTQMNLGNAHIDLGERQSGEEATNALLAAITAYQSALTVFSKDFARDYWANIQNGLAKAYYNLQRWQEAAAAEEAALSLYPQWSEALARATTIYHEHLFQFDRAFELNTRRVSLGEGQDAFIESHLTTARFSDCASQASDRLTQTTDPREKLSLTAVRLACLSAMPGPADARITTAPSDIFTQIHNLQKIGWTFSGTKHFLAQHPAFAAHSSDWVHLFEALEEGDEAKARAALLALGFHE